MTFKTTAEIPQPKYRFGDILMLKEKGRFVHDAINVNTIQYSKENNEYCYNCFYKEENLVPYEPPKPKRKIEFVEYYDGADSFSQLRWIERGKVISTRDAKVIKPTGNIKTVEIEE